MAAGRTFFLSHSLTSGVNISMSRAVFTSIFPHSSLSIIQKAEIYVKFFLHYFAIYFRRHYHRDIKCQDKNALFDIIFKVVGVGGFLKKFGSIT